MINDYFPSCEDESSFLTFDGGVISAFHRHVRHYDCFKTLLPILRNEVFPDPIGLGAIADCSANSITSEEELVCDMGCDVAADARDENNGTFGDCAAHIYDVVVDVVE